MKVIVIAAMDQNRGIGKDNDLMWRLPNDMKFFRETTKGHTVVMGRKNWESIPEKFRPLPGRTNIVITRNKEYKAEGALVMDWKTFLSDIISERIEVQNSIQKDCYIIGGGEIYKKSLDEDLVDDILLTYVDAKLDADVFFPEFSEDDWIEEDSIMTQEADDKHKYRFQIRVFKKVIAEVHVEEED